MKCHTYKCHTYSNVCMYVPENNEEGDIEDDQSTEWNNSDEEYGCIDDDDENDENV